ncbi:ribonuclease E/G family protein [Alteriqipengyuania lutimaris]|uniref:Ribonuclease n=1 Tax=Alteriqipengyuania lutimaris TaxID=1538146 RepID=A0A395LQ52_9SPHN|nr:ribonuclease [Alteriqipengyuania lutimaris]MBB3033251.1 hypothetical protein [Alteriqipengyuania lutimaris]RDS77704.1 ribonuclease [Alteriqipengyuania lutimaris]
MGWLVEHGIAETRALLIEGDRVVAARLHWPGDVVPGPARARLIRRSGGAKRGIARTSDGLEINVSGLPKDASEGREIAIAITRAPIAEQGRYKRAQGTYQGSEAHIVAPDTRNDPFDLPDAKVVPRFGAGAWEDVWSDAWEAEIGFAGGSILVTPTPAMTVIDIDGDLPPSELAMAAVPSVASTLRRLDLGGSVAIDFPTLAEKTQRGAVDHALAEALGDWPHERTAMNGFGIVHLVARLEGPSILHRLHFHRTAAAARMLLRRGEGAEGIGPRLLLRAHPAVADRLEDDWLVELARRSGREVVVERDASLAIAGGHAQVLAS